MDYWNKILHSRCWDLAQISFGTDNTCDVLGSLPEDTLVDVWWASRRMGLLRYPVLEDSSLQLIPPLAIISDTTTTSSYGPSDNGNKEVSSTHYNFFFL